MRTRCMSGALTGGKFGETTSTRLTSHHTRVVRRGHRALHLAQKRALFEVPVEACLTPRPCPAAAARTSLRLARSRGHRSQARASPLGTASPPGSARAHLLPAVARRENRQSGEQKKSLFDCAGSLPYARARRLTDVARRRESPSRRDRQASARPPVHLRPRATPVSACAKSPARRPADGARPTVLEPIARTTSSSPGRATVCETSRGGASIGGARRRAGLSTRGTRFERRPRGAQAPHRHRRCAAAVT
jgi:hypothetical protein